VAKWPSKRSFFHEAIAIRRARPIDADTRLAALLSDLSIAANGFAVSQSTTTDSPVVSIPFFISLVLTSAYREYAPGQNGTENGGIASQISPK
jgi:hypothetical protein